MAVEEVDLGVTADPGNITLPVEFQAYFEEANQQIDTFFESERNKRYPTYIPCNALLVYEALRAILDQKLTFDTVFCEWGSGFGLVTGLAALLGYSACGVEIESELVDRSNKLLDQFGIEATILETSYVPEGFEEFSGIDGAGLILQDAQAQDFEAVYEGMDYPLSEVDVFFVYPWPGDQEFMQQLFDAVAVEGSILLAYHADGEIYAYRKVIDPDEIHSFSLA